MNPPLPPDWKCARRVGFLFPHECRRTTPDGCPDCQNGAIDDPYRTGGNRYDYVDYDDYGSAYYVGLGYPILAAGAGPYDTSMDFTEADGADLVKPEDEFENDMTES